MANYAAWCARAGEEELEGMLKSGRFGESQWREMYKIL